MAAEPGPPSPTNSSDPGESGGFREAGVDLGMVTEAPSLRSALTTDAVGTVAGHLWRAPADSTTAGWRATLDAPSGVQVLAWGVHVWALGAAGPVLAGGGTSAQLTAVNRFPVPSQPTRSTVAVETELDLAFVVDAVEEGDVVGVVTFAVTEGSAQVAIDIAGPGADLAMAAGSPPAQPHLVAKGFQLALYSDFGLAFLPNWTPLVGEA